MVKILCIVLILSTSILATHHQTDEINHIRTRRASGIWGFFETLGSMRRIFNQQYNETVVALNQVYDLVADGFSDTATKRPPLQQHTVPLAVSSSTGDDGNDEDDMTTTTTEKYRISRAELSKILNRNYRGLQKLFRLEWNEAVNQSKYSIKDYQMDVKNAIAGYAVFKNTSKT